MLAPELRGAQDPKILFIVDTISVQCISWDLNFSSRYFPWVAMHSNYHLFTHLHFLAFNDYNHGQALTQISFFLCKLLFETKRRIHITFHKFLHCFFCVVSPQSRKGFKSPPLPPKSSQSWIQLILLGKAHV